MNDETRSDRIRRLLLGLGALVVLVSLPTIVFQEYTGNRSQDNHHAATARQDAEIVTLLKEVKDAQADHASTLNEVKSLAISVNSVIAGLPAADKYLGELALGLESQIVALCVSTHAACPTLSVAHP